MQQQYPIPLTNLKEFKNEQLALFLKTTEGQVVSRVYAQQFGSKIYFLC